MPSFPGDKKMVFCGFQHFPQGLESEEDWNCDLCVLTLISVTFLVSTLPPTKNQPEGRLSKLQYMFSSPARSVYNQEKAS